MKVFISSLIGGFEPARQAVVEAIRTLRHEPVMAEDFRPAPTSPQVACLTGVRASDVVVLLLGERYGAKQASGLSATHEEYEDAVVGGPLQAILRPAQIEEPSLRKALHQAAIFGDAAVFDGERGVKPSISGNALRLSQDRHASISLDEEGSVVVETAVERPSTMTMVITEEDVQGQLALALAFCAWVLDHVDATQRLTHVALAVNVTGGSHLTWRTARENQANPTSVAVNEDATVLLRRQWVSGR